LKIQREEMRFIESEKSWKFDDEQRSGGKIVIQCHGEEKGGANYTRSS